MGGAGYGALGPLESAQSELAEEAGIVARDWRLIGQIEPMSGLCSEVALIYLATEIDIADHARPSEEELITAVRFATLREILSMIRSGDMTDGQSIAAITMASAVVGWL